MRSVLRLTLLLLAATFASAARGRAGAAVAAGAAAVADSRRGRLDRSPGKDARFLDKLRGMVELWHVPKFARALNDEEHSWPAEFRQKLGGVHLRAVGGTAKVFVADSYAGAGKLHGQEVAVKEIQCLTRLHDAWAQREVLVLKRLQGLPEFVQYDSSMMVQMPLEIRMVLIMMEAASEDLESVIARRDELSKAAMLHMFTESLRGLRAMRDLGLIHGDVKPGNLLIFGNCHDVCRVKLADFQNTCAFEGDDQVIMPCSGYGTPLYLAPEACERDPIWGPERDVWAMGIAFYELLFGAPPRTLRAVDMRHGHVGKNVRWSKAVRLRFNIHDDANYRRLLDEDPGLAALLAGMLSHNPTERLTAAEALTLAEALEERERPRSRRGRLFAMLGRKHVAS